MAAITSGVRKSYLIGFVDDATRVSPFSAFAPAENTVVFLPVFKACAVALRAPSRGWLHDRWRGERAVGRSIPSASLVRNGGTVAVGISTEHTVTAPSVAVNPEHLNHRRYLNWQPRWPR